MSSLDNNMFAKAQAARKTAASTPHKETTKTPSSINKTDVQETQKDPVCIQPIESKKSSSPDQNVNVMDKMVQDFRNHENGQKSKRAGKNYSIYVKEPYNSLLQSLADRTGSTVNKVIMSIVESYLDN